MRPSVSTTERSSSDYFKRARDSCRKSRRGWIQTSETPICLFGSGVGMRPTSGVLRVRKAASSQPSPACCKAVQAALKAMNALTSGLIQQGQRRVQYCTGTAAPVQTSPYRSLLRVSDGVQTHLASKRVYIVEAPVHGEEGCKGSAEAHTYHKSDE